jgi:LuxR family maltose regulon positive regulatory protein
MDSPASPLVLTKLRVPALRGRLVGRARLVERLATESGGLALVCAPAGYGKTTLLAEWARALQQRGAAVAWYALDAGDDHPLAFGAYLLASFSEALGPLPELAGAAQRLRAAPETGLPGLLPDLINGLLGCGQACLLVLDDYHLVGSPAIHSALAYLHAHRPANLRIAIGSRSDPPLSLARLRARGELFEIRAAGLRFTAEEAGEFLNEVMRLELSPAGVAALEERTEGWAAGLQLAALSLAGRADKESQIAAFSGSHRYLVEYLLEEVVDRQPPAARAFLLASAVLERMCAPLCEALAGGEGQGQAMLEQLEQANLFVVALDDRRCWFRYHHLFRDFLLARLQRTEPERIPRLHRAACAWLADQGLLREAAGHAFRGGDWEYAAGFVEQHSFAMIVHSDTAALYEWCSAFPEEVMERHPLLCILQCWAWVFSFRQENRARVEARLRQAGQAIANMEDRQAAADLAGHAAVVRSFLDMAPDPAADPRALLASAREMLADYAEGEPGRFSGMLTSGYAHLALHEAAAAGEALETARQLALRGSLFAGIIESTFHLARLAHSRGEPERAAALCRQGLADVAARLPHPEQDLPALGCLEAALGCALLELDHLEEAEGRLLSGLERIGWRTNPFYALTAHLGLFRLYEIQGRSREALAHLARLETAWPDIAFCTRGLRAAHALRIDPGGAPALAEAAAWLCEYAPGAEPPGLGPFGAAEVYYLALLAWLHCQGNVGNARAARPYLARPLAVAQEHGLALRAIELSLAEAELESDAGEAAGRSMAALARALRLARPGGCLRVFDQGPRLARLLELAARQGREPAQAGRILAVIRGTRKDQPSAGAASGELAGSAGQPEPQVNEQAAPLEPLSERELEVLRMIARGASNQAIAGALYVTVGTVKRHVNHILGKLGARNRTDAAARARALGLLEI